MNDQLDEDRERHFPRQLLHRPQRATVTPSANSAHGAAAFGRNCISRSEAVSESASVFRKRARGDQAENAARG
jgi:hypothetical protein